MGGEITAAYRSIQRHRLFGTILVVFLTFGVGGWAATTNLAGALIAPGHLVVSSDVKKVQHSNGGIVGELRVHDGDHVKAGDILVRLDETETRANLAIYSKGLDELTARKARLQAERDGRKSFTFPHELLSRASDFDVADLMAGEQRLFEIRNKAREGQKAQLAQRIDQLKSEIVGLEGQQAAKVQEVAFIDRELVGVNDLYAKKLVPLARLSQLQREKSRLDGESAQLIAAVAQSKGKIAEIQLQIIQVDQDMRSEVGKELREIDAKIGEFVEHKVAAEDQLRRMEIRAPQDGVVFQSTVHTIGGVIKGGDTIMLIVPESDELEVEATVKPDDIEAVHIGQTAVLHFSSFNSRTTPEVDGSVTRVSADTTTDQRSGQSFYTIRISIPLHELDRLGKVKLLPGMPVETFLQTGERTVVSYLIKPLRDQIAKAFTEK